MTCKIGKNLDFGKSNSVDHLDVEREALASCIDRALMSRFVGGLKDMGFVCWNYILATTLISLIVLGHHNIATNPRISSGASITLTALTRMPRMCLESRSRVPSLGNFILRICSSCKSVHLCPFLYAELCCAPLLSWRLAPKLAWQSLRKVFVVSGGPAPW